MRYATEWYAYHAGQRMVAVRFYLTIVGVLLLAYVQTHSSHPGWASGVAFFGTIVSLVFWVLDVRNTELVNCGRAALDELEVEVGLRIRSDDEARRHLPKASGTASWVLRHANKKWVEPIWKFQRWLRLLYVTTFVASLLLAFIAWRSPGVPATVEARKPWSQVRALRMSIEEYLIARKQETSEAVMTARGLMLEAETLGVLRSCRLELGVDPACDRYEAWSDRVLASLHPLRTAHGDQAKAALQGFVDTYARELRAELVNLEREFGGRAVSSRLRPDPIFMDGDVR